MERIFIDLYKEGAQEEVDSLKILANEQHIPYQSLLKTYLNEKIQDAFYREKICESTVLRLEHLSLNTFPSYHFTS